MLDKYQNKSKIQIKKQGAYAPFFEMKKTSKYITAIIIFNILFLSCKNKMEDIKKLTSKIDYPEFTAKNITIYRSDSAKIVLRLETKKMIKYNTKEKNYILFPEGIYAIHYFPDYPHIESYIKSDFAKYWPDKQLWVVKGNVEAQNKKGEKLFGEEIYWDQKLEKIYSDKNIKIQTDEEIIYGKGFEADQYFENYTIKKIKGTVYINEDSLSTN